MLRNAWKEVRHHPGRIVATVIAIAISVAFLAAASTFLATLKSSLGKQLSIHVSQTDVVAELDFANTPTDEPQIKDPAAAVASLQKIEGVKKAEATYASFGAVSTPDRYVTVQFIAVPGEDFRFSTVTDGGWASKKGETTLPKQVAKQLGVGVGDSVKVNDTATRVVGISDDASTPLFKYIYLPAAVFADPTVGAMATYSIKLTEGADANAVVTAAQKALPGYKVQTAESYRQANLKDLTQGINVFKYMFGVFQGIALVVGMIIIANTFTILITQRRRQIGLLRAVGASTSQVRRQIFVEALIIGLIGSVLGVVLGIVIATIGAYFIGALQFGMSIPWGELVVAVVIGTIITFIAAVAPILRTTRVAPLEALRPVLSADREKRVGRIRAVICGVIVAVGVAFAAVSQLIDKGSWPIVWAMFGIAFISIGVLAAAPLYVAGVLRGMGKLIGGTGPTARLAATNSARNPQRAAATAVALMLAMGLIVALQVGTSTVKTTVMKQINDKYPVDLMVTSTQPLTAEQKGVLTSLPDMTHRSLLTGGSVTHEEIEHTVVAGDDQLAAAAPSLPTARDGQLLISNESLKNGSTITVTGADGKPVSLTVKRVEGLGWDTWLVSQTTMKQLVKDPQPNGYVYKAADRENIGAAQQKLTPLMMGQASLVIEGGALQASMLTMVLNVLLGVVTALLGVAVVIALVGVANTLGLSVIERQKESALLRALGMKKAGLRLMLLIESLMLALAGTVMGLIGGAVFAWLLLRAAFRNMDLGTGLLQYSIDPWQTLALLAIASVCAALASVMPGRRAAKASPVEALAVD